MMIDFRLSVDVLSVSVFMLSIAMLNAVMLSVSRQNIIMLRVIMLRVECQFFNVILSVITEHYNSQGVFLVVCDTFMNEL
jgi:hypothetical protein